MTVVLSPVAGRSINLQLLRIDLITGTVSWRRWRRRARIGSFTRLLHTERCWVLSLLLDECRCHVVCSRHLPCQSIFSWVFFVFLCHAHIRGVPVSDIWYDPFFAHDQNTAFTVVVCDLLRPGVDQPYHTPLYSWSCLCELLLQFSSNRTFQIPVICFPVFGSKSKFQSCTSTHWVPLSHIPSTSWCCLCL